MYTENAIILVLISGFLIGLMSGVVWMSIPKTYLSWTYSKVWIATNQKGEIIRAQFEHPSQAVKDSERILKASRGGNIDGKG